MPLDMTNTLVPQFLDFDVEFEPTKFKDKKYVINKVTGEYLGIVGSGFKCASHKDFFENVVDTALNELGEHELQDAKYHFSTARNNAWAMLDITLPNVCTTVYTDKFESEVKNRIISLHGIDGSCSNQAFFGAIDAFCTNGMISGEYDKIRRKNTANFSLASFIDELNQSRNSFYGFGITLQKWANTQLAFVDVEAFLEKLIPSERKAKRMNELYEVEAQKRGKNKWALYSAFTNYASYADDRNGFNLKNTGKDTQAISMFGREQEVSKWVNDNQFQLLAA